MKRTFIFTISLLMIGILILILPVIQSHAAPDQPNVVINKVYITDVRDGSFVVSWTTDVASDGHVDWGLTTALGSTTSDPIASTTTHYITISGLTPNTPYYLQVRSGGVTDDNGGNLYTITTGPTLGIPTPGKTVWGYLYQSNGTSPVPNGIVYIQIQDANASGSPGNAQWVTARTDSSGVWSYDLVNVRTENASAYFTFTDGGDNMRMVWQGGIYGAEGDQPNDFEIYTLPSTYPHQMDKTLAGSPTVVSMVNYAVQTDNIDLRFVLLLSTLLVFGGLNAFLIYKRYRTSGL